MTIAEWKSAGRDFFAGLELYRQHLGETVLYKIMQRSGATAFNEGKLAEALEQIDRPILPARRGIASVHREILNTKKKLEKAAVGSEEFSQIKEDLLELQDELHYLTDTVRDLEDQIPALNKLEEKVEQVIQLQEEAKAKSAKHTPEAKMLMNERSQLHAQLRMDQPQDERRMKAQRILEIGKQLDRIYKPPPAAPEPAPITDRAAMVKRIGNLRSSISKHKNNPKREAEVTAWRLEVEKLQAQLSEDGN